MCYCYLYSLFRDGLKHTSESLADLLAKALLCWTAHLELLANFLTTLDVEHLNLKFLTLTTTTAIFSAKIPAMTNIFFFTMVVGRGLRKQHNRMLKVSNRDNECRNLGSTHTDDCSRC